jgi:hypothetical protein
VILFFTSRLVKKNFQNHGFFLVKTREISIVLYKACDRYPAYPTYLSRDNPLLTKNYYPSNNNHHLLIFKNMIETPWETALAINF